MHQNEITVHLNRFDGPLALLLHLVQRDEISVKELELNRITQQYLDYLDNLKELNFDIAGDYLYMAATLLHLKSERSLVDDQRVKQLLEREEFEITSKEDLIRKLETLQAFQKAGEVLWQLPKKNHEIFLRPRLNRKALSETLVKPTDSQELVKMMVDWLALQQRKFVLMKRDRLSIKEKLVSLKQSLKQGQRSEFSRLISSPENTLDVVITFISLLELTRLQKITLYQVQCSGEIYVDVLEELDGFDVNQADGFDEPHTESTELAAQESL